MKAFTAAYLAYLLAFASAKVVKYEWELSYRTISPNGVSKRMALVNNQFPGPTMRASLGDQVQVTLVNNLPDNGTSVRLPAWYTQGAPLRC